MTQPLESASSRAGLDDLRRAALDAVSVHIALLDHQGAIVMVNEAWRRFALDNGPEPGLPAPRCGSGVNYLAVCQEAEGPSSEGAGEAADGIRAVLEGRQARFELEYPCHSPEQRRWFLMTVSPLAMPGDGMVVTHADITRRKLAEITQHDNELRMQLALEATGDGLWDWNVCTGQAYLSPGYYALTGYRPEDVTPDFAFFQRLVHPDDLPGVLAIMEPYLRGETPVSEIEYRMVTASGAIRWIRGRGRVVERDAEGAPLRMVGHISDISEYKRIEQALKESEARYRAVVEGQTEVIGRFRADGTILFVNEVYCRLFGKTAEELTGRKWQPVVHPGDLSMIEARLAELTPEHPVAVIENRIFDGHGEMRWMQFINHAFFDAAGCITEIQAVGRDISERKQIESRQAALLEENTLLGRELIQLQEKERTNLARELHDELSQQLVAIRAHAGAIRRRATGADERHRADAIAIEASVSQIYNVSHQLMEGLHPQVLDSAGLAEAVRALLSNWSQLHPAIRVTLRLAGPLDDIGEEARIHLFRIAQEGLANLARHARAGRARLFLGETSRRGRRAVCLVLRDNGVGMDIAAPRVGFGLIVMRERAHNLGGSFELWSRPGGGTRIAVALPLPA
jgi:PAS domain S-box-containing protein